MSSRADSVSAALPSGARAAAQASLCWVSNSRTDTQALAAQLACCLVPGLVIALHGDLGAGKTTFVQGLAAGLGIRTRVTSPTFILANEYQTPRGWRLVHVDAYRLSEGAEEAAAFGLEELLDATDTIVAIEWAELVSGLLPADCLQIWLQAEESDLADESRTITLVAGGPQSVAILAALSVLLPMADKLPAVPVVDPGAA